MNNISNYSTRSSASPASNASAHASKAASSASGSQFGPMVAGALTAIAAANAPSSAVCAISKEGISELSKASRDAYHAASTAVNSTSSFLGQAMDTVEKATYNGINDIKTAAHKVGQQLSEAGTAISDGASTVVHTVGDAIDSAEQYVGHAVIAGVNAFNKIV